MTRRLSPPQSRSREPLTEPTQKQLLLLGLIRAFQETHGISPTIRELQHLMGLKSVSGIAFGLKRLRQLGLITWIDCKSRSIRIVDPPSQSF